MSARDRRLTVGASDIAAILGIDPFRSAAELWRQRIENDPFIGNKDTARGLIFEEALCQFYCSEYFAGVKGPVRKQVALTHPNTWAVATPDMILRAVPIGQTSEKSLVVDVKCPRSPSKPVKGSSPLRYEKKWCETQQLAPLGYQAQSVWQQGVARASGVECDGGELAAGLFFGEIVRVYVPWDPTLFALMLERAEEFLSHVTSGQLLPPSFSPTIEESP